MYFKNDDTICAPATTPGTGAISVIRVSGPDALKITDCTVKCRSGKTEEAEGYTIKFGTVYLADGKALDEVLVSIFRAPHSYTGENSVEISCHASKYIVDQIMQLLMQAGARAAEPGEFTQRAYLNGKMDLAQAEAVADLIASQNASAHRIAFNQMKGGFSTELKDMRASLLKIVSLMELELDFSEEEVEFADRSELNRLLEKVIAHISGLVESFRLGNAIKNGIPVAIAGATNTGKSTLLNALLGEERAIVSDIHGTTRDTVEETLNIEGTLFRFIDTAGIRETSEVVEKIGIERTFRKISEAEIVLGMLDLSRSEDEIRESLEEVLPKINPDAQTLVVLLNKSDLSDAAEIENKKTFISGLITSGLGSQDNDGRKAANPAIIPISAKFNSGITELKAILAEKSSSMVADSDTTLVTNLRHVEALSNANTALQRVKEGLAAGIPTDLAAQDIREALYHIGSIVGEISTDEVLGNIFRNFCIGK